MKARAFYDLARFLPLMSWSGNASLLGIASAMIATGNLQSIEWSLTVPAVFMVVCLQYVAHPINDLVDYPVDMRANIDGTGRRKVLISGLATEQELRWLSRGLLVVISVVAAYIIWFRPLALFFGLVGFLSVWAYNTAPLRLSYRPFSELIVATPVNMAMVAGIAYVATGNLVVISLVLGVAQAFMASAVHISYFAMDMQSDYLGGKFSTVVRFPGFQWCTLYPAVGIAVLCYCTALSPGIWPLIVPVSLLGGMAIFGSHIDHVWMEYRRQYDSSLQTFVRAREKAPADSQPHLSTQMLNAWHHASGAMRRTLVHQMYLSILNGVVLFLFALGGVFW